jgi:hypothetical protein
MIDRDWEHNIRQGEEGRESTHHIPECEQRLDIPVLVVLVSDVQVLSVPDPPSLGVEMTEARHILLPLREGQAQLAARVVPSKQYVGDGGASGVTQVPSMHERGDLIDPWEGDSGSGLGDDDGLRIRLN